MKKNSIPLNQFRCASELTLPDGWVQGVLTRGKSSLAQQFHPTTEGEASIIICSRGHALPEEMATRLRKVLTMPAHALDELERQRITSVFDQQGVRARFNMTSARTEEWQGKMLLITEGTYSGTGDQAFTLFVDVDGDGQWLEELQYSAPAAEYNTHLEDAMSSFRSIIWSNSSN